MNKQGVKCLVLASGISLSIMSSVPKTNTTFKPTVKAIRNESLTVNTIKYGKLISMSNNCDLKQTNIMFNNTSDKDDYYIKEIPLSKELQKYTYDLCEENDVDYETVLSIMYEESRFETNKINYNNNGTRDYGLMQINSCHKSEFKEQGVTNILDPYQNIKFAVNMLADINKKYKNTRDRLMCYGLGETGMKRAKRRGVITTKAAKIVLDKKTEYEKLAKTI